MEIAVAVALALAVGLSLRWLLGARRRRGSGRRPAEGLVGLTTAGAPVSPSTRNDEELDLEEGALDPDELEGDPLYWDEGADDEVD